jgi:hypothetical protein
MTRARLFASAVRGALLLALPSSVLRRRLERRLSLPNLPCYAVMSGRVALFLLAREIARTTDRRLALVPDYICNVVPVALEHAGFRVEPYPTDEGSEADEATLRRRLGQGDVALLVTASVFGSSAFLDALARAEWRDLLVQHGVHVVVDLCQDLSLTARVPLTYGRNLSVIVSFNDKSIPGLMGGGVLTALGPPDGISPLTWSEMRSLVALARLRARQAIAGRQLVQDAIAPTRAFEFSRCEAFPYAFDATGVSKLQVVAALVGLANLATFRAAKRRWLETCADAVAVPHIATSPYVVVRSRSSAAGRRLKQPYAVHRQPSVSLRPDQVIVHNKGFSDLCVGVYE